MTAQLTCFLASYIVAFMLELARLWKSHVSLRWASLGFTAAGVVAQIWYLLARSQASQLPPLLASTHDWLLVSALLLVGAYLVYMIIAFRREGFASLGLFVLPLALAMVGAASLVRTSPDRLLESARFWKMLHASSLSIGITGVLIGFVLSLMYLLQHRRLKQKKNLGRGFALPPLTALARYNWWMIIISVPMLTLGLLTGYMLILQARQSEVPFAWGDPVVIGFSVLWIGMVALFVWLLYSKPSRNRQVAMLTAWSCGFLVITLVGLQVLVSLTGIPSQHGALPGAESSRLARLPYSVQQYPHDEEKP